MGGEARQKLRIDKWLWYARVMKTRSLCARHVQSGNVRVNGTKVASPSASVKVGDVLTIGVNQGVRVLQVEALGERRGPAMEAATLFIDLSPKPINTGKATPQGTPSPGRRPDKRERQKIISFKEGLE